MSSLSVPLEKQYYGAGFTEKTVHRDIEKLVALELVRKSGVGNIANTNILCRMIAKPRSPNNGS